MRNLYKFTTKDGNVKIIAKDETEARALFPKQAPNKTFTKVELVQKDIK